MKTTFPSVLAALLVIGSSCGQAKLQPRELQACTHAREAYRQLAVFRGLPERSAQARAAADAVFIPVRDAYAEYAELGRDSYTGPVRMMNKRAHQLAFDLTREIDDGVVELAYMIGFTVGACNEARR